MKHAGVDAYPAHFESPQGKEGYYRWFESDVVVGIGYGGQTPHIVLHPQRYGVTAVPWLVADGFVTSYHEIINALPLVLTTSKWAVELFDYRIVAKRFVVLITTKLGIT